jgi:hypothetical protein
MRNSGRNVKKARLFLTLHCLTHIRGRRTIVDKKRTKAGSIRLITAASYKPAPEKN